MNEPRNASVIPILRYADAASAIDWLCRAFGFERHVVDQAEDGTIGHAQLTYGNGMVMVGTARDDAWGKLQKTVKATGVATGAICVVVPDADAHHARAVAAGARVVMELEDHDYGGRGYTCLDPEGNVWNFGTYDPWADPQG